MCRVPGGCSWIERPTRQARPAAADRHVELAVQDRVARGILVHVGGAMADPLARHEDRQLHVELDLAHLEGRGVAVAQQVVDEAAVLAHLLGALAVGDARRLHDRGVIAHVVDDAHEAVVEHREGLVENLFERRDSGATRRLGRIGEGVDLGLLFGGKRHRNSRRSRIEDGESEINGSTAATPGSFLPLPIPPPETYIYVVGQPTMAINAMWNKRSGPGGSTRRLHQLRPPKRSCAKEGSHGGETGSTRVVKAWFLLGMVPPLSGQSLSANDNRMVLAA